MAKEKVEVGDEEEELGREEHRGFRGEVALLNYMGQDRSDIQYMTNQVSRMMVRPTVGARSLVKRAGRYLVGAQKVVWKYGDMGDGVMTMRIDVYVDSDWAGAADRKSTSGGVMMMKTALHRGPRPTLRSHKTCTPTHAHTQHAARRYTHATPHGDHE